MTENPSQQDVDEALREVDDLIESIGDQTPGTITEQTDDGQNITVRQVQHGSHGYAIIASPAFQHVKVQTGFDAAEVLAATEGQATAGGEVQQVQVSEPAIQSASNALQSRISDNEIGEIRAELVNRLSTDKYVVQLNADDTFVTGFTVEDHLFVYDRNHTVEEFSKTVQGVINVMWRGQEYLVNKYDLRDAVNGGRPGPRAFQ